jgi:hypothetical protein
MKVESVCEGGVALAAMGPARVRGALRLSRVTNDGKCIVKFCGRFAGCAVAVTAVAKGTRGSVIYIVQRWRRRGLASLAPPSCHLATAMA